MLSPLEGHEFIEGDLPVAIQIHLRHHRLDRLTALSETSNILETSLKHKSPNN